MMTLLVSDESLARNTHIHAQTHTYAVLYLKRFQSKTLKPKREEKQIERRERRKEEKSEWRQVKLELRRLRYEMFGFFWCIFP